MVVRAASVLIALTRPASDALLPPGLLVPVLPTVLDLRQEPSISSEFEGSCRRSRTVGSTGTRSPGGSRASEAGRVSAINTDAALTTITYLGGNDGCQRSYPVHVSHATIRTFPEAAHLREPVPV